MTERQKFCKAELMVVSVNRISTGKLNDCTNNALDATEEGDEVRTITGSLVHPYDAITNTTEIVQHWWNMNSDGTYFDTTPGVTDDCEYVKDMDLIYLNLYTYSPTIYRRFLQNKIKQTQFITQQLSNTIQKYFQPLK